ncbi:unnamed protein product [Pylaiella littoralis]
MENCTIRASKAMEAIFIEILPKDAKKAAKVEKAMMGIQTSIEEFINAGREKVKDVLPKL